MPARERSVRTIAPSGPVTTGMSVLALALTPKDLGTISSGDGSLWGGCLATHARSCRPRMRHSCPARIARAAGGRWWDRGGRMVVAECSLAPASGALRHATLATSERGPRPSVWGGSG